MRNIALETLIWSAAISATALAAPVSKMPLKSTPTKSAKPSVKPNPKPSAKPGAKSNAKTGAKSTKTTKTASKPAVKPIVTPVVANSPSAPVEKAAETVAAPLYQNDLQKLAVGKLPDEFLVLGGEFSLVKDGENVLIELPPDPIDAFGLLFGPTMKNEGATASARFYGTKKGRRMPSFGAGIFGISGYKLRLSPAAGKLEILKDEIVKAEMPFEWKSETWTRLKIQARPLEKGQWKVEGRAWADGEKEPEAWQLEWTDVEAPPAGRASLIGAPYSGLPIRFDDLMADKIK